jgi:hypothetical protein
MTTEMTTRETLVKARELIIKPENWRQGTAARTKTGRETSPSSRYATQFCALGALSRVTRGPVCITAQIILSVAIGRKSIVIFNDIHTHAEVIEMFDKAIEAERNKTNE